MNVHVTTGNASNCLTAIWTTFVTLLAFFCFKTLTYFSILTTLFFYINGRLYNQVYSFSENIPVSPSSGFSSSSSLHISDESSESESNKFGHYLDAKNLENQQQHTRKDLEFENNPNPTIFNLETIAKISNRFKKRGKAFSDVCSSSNHDRYMLKSSKIPSILLTSQKQKLAGCLPLETASVSWFYVFWSLDHPTKKPPKTGFYNQMISKKKFNIGEFIEMGKSFNSSDYTRIIAVRHPLTRLYSGWKDQMKFENKNGNLVHSLQAKLWEFSEDAIDFKTNHSCTWDKFVYKFLEAALNQKYPIDSHHKPVSKLCKDCMMNYEYIVKMETMDEDSEFILNHKFGFSNFKMIHANRKKSGNIFKSDDFFDKYCGFSDEIIKKIEDYYDRDYLLYSYDKFDRMKSC